MAELNDQSLLAEYVRRGSEAAFTELVRRHAGLVFSTAHRFCGNPHQAEEITQAVFILLARKAETLSARVVVSGWLYQTARLLAANFVKGEIRRQRREQEACMQSDADEGSAPEWEKIAPLLDAAMGALGETDRNALLLRYFENRTAQEIGAVLRLSEETARKRVNRALEKLRQHFASQGVAVSGTALSSALAAQSVQPVSAAMIHGISTLALAKGATASTSTLTLIKGALKIMAWTKAKTAIVAGMAVMLAAGTTTIAVKTLAHPKLSGTDLSWADDPGRWQINSRVLETLPSGVFIFRPTRFPDGGGVWAGDRMLVRNESVSGLMDRAFNISGGRTVFPPGMPGDRFDVLSTLPGGVKERLCEELKTRFQLAGHIETRNVDVMLIKVQNANPPNLKPHQGKDMNSSWFGGNGETKIENSELSGFFGTIETRLGQPVLDETGLKGRYDLKLTLRDNADQQTYVRALAEQLGLELVPATRPVEMLVVEKGG